MLKNLFAKLKRNQIKTSDVNAFKESEKKNIAKEEK
jgi:hypothetical protein